MMMQMAQCMLVFLFDKAEFFKKYGPDWAPLPVFSRWGQEPPASRQARNGQAAGVSVDACPDHALFASFDFTLHHIRSEGYQPVYGVLVPAFGFPATR